MAQDVLIVDDSATLRRMVRRSMEIAGLDIGEVYEASNGTEALAQLADHHVAVMLLDMNMPVMNGMQLLARVKTSERLKDIPVVIASSEGSRERMAQIERFGAFGYIRKPFRPEQLRDVLEPLVGVRGDAGTEQADAVDGRC